MVIDKFGAWIKGGSSKQNTRRWITRLRLMERRLERQRKKLMREEEKMTKAIQDAVDRGDIALAKQMARDVARNRKMANGLQRMIGHLRGIKFKLEQAQTMQDLSADLKGVVKTLHDVNRNMNMPRLEKILAGIEEGTAQLDEVMGVVEESFDSVSYTEADDAEAEKVLDEILAGKAAESTSALPEVPVESEQLAEEIAKLKQKMKSD